MIDEDDPGDRWSHAGDRWPIRSARIAAVIPSGSRVLDVGAGAEGLASRLRPRCFYVPVDRVRRSERTVIADLDAGDPLPSGFDVVVAAGLLEYLEHPDRLFVAARTAAPRLLVSYVRAEFESPEWVNRLEVEQLRALAEAAGWATMRKFGSSGKSDLWEFA